jgi:hypothetical protein
MVSGVIGYPFLGGEAQFFLDKNKRYDLGVIAGGWENIYNLSLFGRRWFLTNKGNPWRNIYISLQGSDAFDDVENIEYFYSHVELGFSPGFFRKVFNISLNLNLSLFPFEHFGFGLEFSLGLGFGSLKDIDVLAIPPLIRAFLSIRF